MTAMDPEYVRHQERLRGGTVRPYRPRRTIEKEVERRVDALCALAGCATVRFSQARATQQTPGIPDRLYFAPTHALAFWVECKAPGGRQSVAQAQFQARALACGMPYVLGGYRDVAAFLVERGLWRLPPGVTLNQVAPA